MDASSDRIDLVRLSESDEYEIADGDPDLRGWEVSGSARVALGSVVDLLIDPELEEVRFLEVKLKEAEDASGEERCVLLPIGLVRLDDARRQAVVDDVDAERLRTAPWYSRGALTPEYRRSIQDVFASSAGPSSSGDDPLFKAQ